MAKPRTFISSTCYDLVEARATLGKFLKGLGHEVLASETATLGVIPGREVARRRCKARAPV